jgi:ribosomal protein S18 acetylase RimI-like enzyme
MRIRNYINSDRKAVEDIHFDTGFLGESMSQFLSDKKEYAKKIKYYLEKEPESIFVAEEKNKIAGYVLGCLDDKKYNQGKSLIILLLSNLFKLLFMKKLDRLYWSSQIKMLFNILIGKSGELKLKHPENASHIHINLLPEYRRKGVGTKLIGKFSEYAKCKGVKTIHADSFEISSKPKKKFWAKNGFMEYSKVKTGFWQDYLPNEEIYVVCYVKELK